MACCGKTKLASARTGAEGPDALSSGSELRSPLLTLEGCGPSQPRNPIKSPALYAWLVAAKRSWHRPVGRQGTRTPSRSGSDLRSPFLTLEGCGPLAAAKPNKEPRIVRMACCGKTKLASTN